MSRLKAAKLDLLVHPSPELIEYIEHVQSLLSVGLDPRLLKDRTPEGREKDLNLLRGVAQRRRPSPDYDDLDPLIKTAYAAVGSPEAFEAQIEQLAQMATGAESILALNELLDVWNQVEGIVSTLVAKTSYKMRNVALATSVSRSLSARTFLSPDGDTQIILFYERMFAFIEHVSFLLPLAISPEAIQTESLDDFPAIAIKEAGSFKVGTEFDTTVRLLFERYRAGSLNRNSTWSHGFGQYQRLVAQDMASAMKFFVIGHELAHCLCEHQGKVLHWSFAAENETKSNVASLAELERDWDQELEADYVGFRLGTAISRRHGISLETYCWACYLLFYALSRCTAAKPARVMPSPTEEWRRHDSHPPLERRQSWLEEIATSDSQSQSSPKSVSFEPVKALCRLIDKYVGGEPSATATGNL